jgi:RecA-family ATPase
MLELLQSLTTSAELLGKHFEPMQWLLQDMIPAEGLTVLGSKMGNGKSYFLLQLAAALSTGTPFLGRETKRHGVLLIALEDSERRINARLNQLGVIGTDKLLIETRWAKGKHALEDLRLILRCQPMIRTVIIDPIVKFIDLIDFNEYGGAYDTMGPIKDILDGLHVAGIFSHHAKKSVSDVDAFDDLLGSTGWGAACDTRLVLRRQRGSPEGTLIAGGRDVLHSESALLFDGDHGWQYQGAAEDIKMSEERREILDLLEEAEPLSATEISDRLKKNYKTTHALLEKLQESGRVFRDATNPKKYRKALRSVGTSEKSPTLPIAPTLITTPILPTAMQGGDLFPEGEQ